MFHFGDRRPCYNRRRNPDRTIGRHLQLLQELGYPVQHESEGYCCKGEPGTPKSGTKFTPSAYPLLILKVLDATPKTQTAMIKEIRNKSTTFHYETVTR